MADYRISRLEQELDRTARNYPHQGLNQHHDARSHRSAEAARWMQSSEAESQARSYPAFAQPEAGTQKPTAQRAGNAASGRPNRREFRGEIPAESRGMAAAGSCNRCRSSWSS
jgi:hypothetical protein